MSWPGPSGPAPLLAARRPARQIVAFVEADAREPIDVEYLPAWIALRVDRAVHQAGERSPLKHPRFACHYWMSAEDRDRLMAWLRLGVEAGATIRPPLPRTQGSPRA